MAAVAEAEYEVGLTIVTFPYNEVLIEELKAEIPSWARQWDGNRRAWKISSEYWEKAAALIENHFPIVG